MSESLEPRKHERLELEVIAETQVDFLSRALINSEVETEIFRSGFQLEKTNNEKLYCHFPAAVESNRNKTRTTLYYDKPTIDYLVDTFTESYRVRPSELKELYIGTGLAAHLLMDSVKAQKPATVVKLLDVLTDVSFLCDQVRATDAISDKVVDDAIMSLMDSDNDRSGNINVLRFAFGMVYLRSDEQDELINPQDDIANSRENRITKRFQRGLNLTLQGKPRYFALAKLFNREDAAETMFTDSISEFEFAACFPMQIPELRNILEISGS